jgi:hypothetical protein
MRKDKFDQVVVWPGTIVGKDKVQEFVDFMQKTFNVRVKYLEEITVPREGMESRNDLFFSVHSEDLTGKFAVERLQYGMRWVEDVLDNEEPGKSVYPSRVVNYRTW